MNILLNLHLIFITTAHCVMKIRQTIRSQEIVLLESADGVRQERKKAFCGDRDQYRLR